MPRPHRKRGRGKRPKDDEAFKAAPWGNHPNVEPVANVTEVEEAPEAGPSSLMDGSNDAAMSPSFPFPELDPDSKAYWKGIDEKIKELEGLGIGRRKRPHGDQDEKGEDDEEEEDDERKLLLRSALGELSGHELALAADPETSVILERLLHSMDDFGKRVLLDRFTGHVPMLSTHRHASHALQTLFVLSAPTLEREAKGKVARHPNPNPDDNAAGSLPTMSELVASACQDLLPPVEGLSQNSSSSHILSLLLFMTSGEPLPQHAFRSRKVQKFRGRQAPMQGMGVDISLGGSSFDDTSTSIAVEPSKKRKGKGKSGDSKQPWAGRILPSVYNAGTSLYASLRGLWTADGGNAARRAATAPTTAQLVQSLVTIEYIRGDSEKPGSVTDYVLDSLVTLVASGAAKDRKRSEFVEGCLRDATPSHLFELIITRSSDALFAAFYDTYFSSRLTKLASHPVANFVTARAILRLPSETFQTAVKELVDGQKLAELVNSGRTGPIHALITRAAALRSCEAEVFTAVMEAFGVADEGDNESKMAFALACILPLMRLEHFRKTKAYDFLSSPGAKEEPPSKLPETSTQGSLLLQALLHLASPSVDTFLDRAVHTLPLPFLIAYAHDPSASRVLDVVVSSPSLSPRHRRQLLLKLIGSYPLVADDRVGSRFADRCWDAADGYLKEKIAESLVGKQAELQKSQWAHHFARKVQLPLFERRREEWKIKAAVRFPANDLSPPVASTSQGTGPVTAARDIVDEIFESVVKTQKRPKASKARSFRDSGGEGSRAAKARKTSQGQADVGEGNDKVAAAAAEVLGQQGMRDLMRSLKAGR